VLSIRLKFLTDKETRSSGSGRLLKIYRPRFRHIKC